MLMGGPAIARAGFRALLPMARRQLMRRPQPIPAPGMLGKMAQRGEIDRPWPGVYRGILEEGRTQPMSYRSPRTVELPESADELADLLRQIGGTYGPTP